MRIAIHWALVIIIGAGLCQGAKVLDERTATKHPMYVSNPPGYDYTQWHYAPEP